MKVAVQHAMKHVVALLEVGCQVLFDAGMHSPSSVLSLQSKPHPASHSYVCAQSQEDSFSAIDTSACCALRQPKHSELVQLDLCTTGHAQ